MRRWTFTKGHGTENDFVLIQDRESMLTLTAGDVRAICDRHAGIGADGVLRAVKAKHIDGWDGDGDVWFMDYRNADGSLAEMCGNGLRVFTRFLLDQDLTSGPDVLIGTRAGLMQARALRDGRVRVSMGPVTVAADPVTVTTSDGRSYAATSVDVGNPHAVCFTDDLATVPLQSGPTWAPQEAFPDGVNREFVRVLGERHIAMRVFERGVGETRSCGTGTVAAAAAAAIGQPGGQDTGEVGLSPADRLAAVVPVTYRVDVLGGSVEVELGAEQAFLTGPAVLVAHGELSLPEEL